MIIDKINKVYQDKLTNLDKILNKKKKYLIKFNKIGNKDYISLSKDNKIILSGLYNFYGIYQPSTKLWIWASSIPNVNKNIIKNINKIKSFAHLFENDNIEENFYNQLLTQDTIYITDLKLLEWINKILLYLSKDIAIFHPTNSDNNIQFISLISIHQQFV
jgi:hypothetical protein